MLLSARNPVCSVLQQPAIRNIRDVVWTDNSIQLSCS